MNFVLGRLDVGSGSRHLRLDICDFCADSLEAVFFAGEFVPLLVQLGRHSILLLPDFVLLLSDVVQLVLDVSELVLVSQLLAVEFSNRLFSFVNVFLESFDGVLGFFELLLISSQSFAFFGKLSLNF